MGRNCVINVPNWPIKLQGYIKVKLKCCIGMCTFESTSSSSSFAGCCQYKVLYHYFGCLADSLFISNGFGISNLPNQSRSYVRFALRSIYYSHCSFRMDQFSGKLLTFFSTTDNTSPLIVKQNFFSNCVNQVTTRQTEPSQDILRE